MAVIFCSNLLYFTCSVPTKQRISAELFQLLSETTKPLVVTEQERLIQIASLYPDALTVRNGNEQQLPLHLLCTGRFPLETVELFLTARPESIRMVDRLGRTPLHYACKTNHNNLELVKLLVDQWPDATLCANVDGELPLHVACRRPVVSLPILQCLILQHAPAKQSTRATKDQWDMLPVHYACFHTNQAAVIELLASTDNNPGDLLMHKSAFYGGLPLHHAASRRRCISLDVIRCLVQMAPDSVAIPHDAGGWLPLDQVCRSCERQHYMSSLRWREVVEALVPPNETPLHFACQHSKFVETLRCIAQLYPEHVQRPMKMTNGELPLHVACQHHANNTCSSSSLDKIRFLVSLFPDSVQVVNSNGDLALHCACRTNGNELLVKFLVERYPQVIHCPNKAGDLPLHCLCEANAMLSTMEYMVEQDPCMVRVPNHSGELPLHKACQSNTSSLSVIEYLVKKYPDSVQVPSTCGHVALHYLCRREPVELSFLQFLTPLYPKALRMLSCCSSGTTKQLPLHYALVATRQHASLAAIAYLLREYPESVWTPNSEGWLPVHVACFQNCRLDIVHHLIQQHPESLSPMNLVQC